MITPDDTVLNAGLAVLAGEGFRAELRLGLPARLLNRVLAFESLDSTNTYAREHGDSLPDDTIIIADSQRAGRGRLTRSWYSERGSSLLLTFVKALPADISSDVSACVSRAAIGSRLYPLAVAVAVSEAIEAAAGVADVEVKWPNDIQYRGNKLAGILIGSMVRDRCAVGIGINVGDMVFPASLRGSATTVTAIGGRSISRMKVMAQIADAVDARIDALSTEQGCRRVLAAYRERLAGIGTNVTLHDSAGGPGVSGVLVGVQDDGAIVLRTADGESPFHAGDLTMQNPRTAG